MIVLEPPCSSALVLVLRKRKCPRMVHGIRFLPQNSTLISRAKTRGARAPSLASCSVFSRVCMTFVDSCIHWFIGCGASILSFPAHRLTSSLAQASPCRQSIGKPPRSRKRRQLSSSLRVEAPSLARTVLGSRQPPSSVSPAFVCPAPSSVCLCAWASFLPTSLRHEEFPLMVLSWAAGAP